MLLPRLWTPLKVAAAPSTACIAPTKPALEALRTAALSPFSTTFVRHATHQSEGRASQARDGVGRRLGAKKTGEEYVIPGNIIFRQRGTLWHPGENVGCGRDHTIFALEPGFVKYYRDPQRHPKRRYIGVVFNREDTLPYPRHAARKRRLGMVAEKIRPVQEDAFGPIEEVENDVDSALGKTAVPRSTTPWAAPRTASTTGSKPSRPMGKRYMYRESNWEIGRAAERANVQVKKFVPGDRFLAWKKREARKAKAMEKKTMKGRKKGSGGSKSKGRRG